MKEGTDRSLFGALLKPTYQDASNVSDALGFILLGRPEVGLSSS